MYVIKDMVNLIINELLEVTLALEPWISKACHYRLVLFFW